MKASDAHALRVGDFVTARFGGRGYVKSCEIIRIEWPKFLLRTTDCNGREMIRSRKYDSLLGKGTGVPSFGMPSWLSHPKTGEIHDK